MATVSTRHSSLAPTRPPRKGECTALFSTATDPGDEIPSLFTRVVNMAWTYMLLCSDGSFYIGSTRDLDARLWQHENGLGARYTARRLPVKLVWSEEFESVVDAFYFEKQIQNWSRAKREALVQGRLHDLPALSRSRFRRPKKGP